MPSPAEPVSRRARPAKAPLSRQSILEAAMALIRENGVEAVSLRHVAARVETGPASLYAYFGNRDILLEHVLDAAYAEVSLVDATDDGRGWRDALAGTIVNTIETLEIYPGLGAIALGSIPVLPGALRLAEHELALMESGGVPAERAALAVDLIAQFAASTAVERTVRLSRGDVGDDRAHVLTAYEHADPERFPHVARSASLLTGPDDSARRDFAIDVLLAGIERAGVGAPDTQHAPRRVWSVSVARSTVGAMTPATLFLHADAALREVIDQLDPADFSAPVPKEWSQLESPTLLGILGRHAYDEAWIPDVLAGRAAADGDPYADVDLLGDDPIASYDALNDEATAAVRSGDIAETFRFTYGDYPADEGFAHLATYRAFQAYSIAKHFGIPFHLSPELVAGFNKHVTPHADEWRQWGVFPPAIEPPADADDETRLLCALGFWQP